MPNRNNDNWFAYGRGQSIKRFFGGQRLLWPVLSIDSNYVFDEGETVFTGGGNGPYYGLQLKPDTRESIFYIQAILNHWLMEKLVKSRASSFRGDYYSHGKQFVATLPIYKIDFENPMEAEVHSIIVQGVQSLEALVSRRNAAQTKQQRGTFERAIKVGIDRLADSIDSLYGITKEMWVDNEID